MSFEQNWRRKQEIANRPIADKLYSSVFGNDTQIQRMEKPDDAILDKRFAIDVVLTLPNQQILLGQEKFLSRRYASFKSVTVEHYQNPITKEPGDWFNLAAQFYFVGYLTQGNKAFKPWILLNWPNVVIATNEDQIPWRGNKNKDGHARASFRYCLMAQFPPECIIAQSPKE